MVKIKTKGSFKNTENFFAKSKNLGSNFKAIMEKYGQQGVDALRNATPQSSGLTANSWYYTIQNWGISFCNSNVKNGVPVVILIQYGHGTGNGGYVQGIDFINPALKSIFDKIADDCAKEVKNL